MITPSQPQAARSLFNLLISTTVVPLMDFANALGSGADVARVRLRPLIDAHDCLTETTAGYRAHGATEDARRVSATRVFERLNLRVPPKETIPGVPYAPPPRTAYPWRGPPRAALTPAELTAHAISALDLPPGSYRCTWSKSTTPLGLRIVRVDYAGITTEQATNRCNGYAAFDRDDRVVVAFEVDTEGPPSVLNALRAAVTAHRSQPNLNSGKTADDVMRAAIALFEPLKPEN